MKNLKLTGLLLMAVIGLNSCSDDDDTPVVIHDHEGIHEMVVQVTDLDGSNPIHYEYVAGQLSGETISLAQNTTYNLEIVELNAHEEEGEHNIIHEVIDAVEEHFILYSKSDDLNFALQRTDDVSTTRDDGTQIGIKTQLTTMEAGAGVLQIEIKHQPTTVDALANDGFGSSTGGATDVQASFPILVE